MENDTVRVASMASDVVSTSVVATIKMEGVDEFEMEIAPTDLVVDVVLAATRASVPHGHIANVLYAGDVLEEDQTYMDLNMEDGATLTVQCVPGLVWQTLGPNAEASLDGTALYNKECCDGSELKGARSQFLQQDITRFRLCGDFADSLGEAFIFQARWNTKGSYHCFGLMSRSKDLGRIGSGPCWVGIDPGDGTVTVDGGICTKVEGARGTNVGLTPSDGDLMEIRLLENKVDFRITRASAIASDTPWITIAVDVKCDDLVPAAFLLYGHSFYTEVDVKRLT